MVVVWRDALIRPTIIVAVLTGLLVALNLVLWAGSPPAGGGGIYVGSLFGVLGPWARRRLRNEWAAFGTAGAVLVIGLGVVNGARPLDELPAWAYYLTFAIVTWSACVAFAAVTHLGRHRPGPRER